MLPGVWAALRKREVKIMAVKDTVHEKAVSKSAYTDKRDYFTKDVDISKLKRAIPAPASCGSTASITPHGQHGN